MTLRSVAGHRAAVASRIATITASETVPLRAALGRVTAADVTARTSVPPFDDSSMDGFALRAADAGRRPLVVARVFAGDAPAPLPPAAAVAIMTGAPVPQGADAVVPVERTRESASGLDIDGAVVAGDFIRRAGSDIGTGDVVLGADTVLAPRHLAALAATGHPSVAVRRRPRVAVVATGSELVPLTEPLGPARIYDSNSVTLAALCERNGADVVWAGAVGDDPTIALETFTELARIADLVITAGGVSAGEREPVKQALGGFGWFGKVAMQPGGPQGLAEVAGTPFICLPGNPVSVQVSFDVLVRDALRAAGGLPPVVVGRARLAASLTSPAGRCQFRRGVLDGDGAVAAVGGPGSHLVTTAARADVLIEIPAESIQLPEGTEVSVWPMTD